MYVISAQVGPCTPSWDGNGSSTGSLTLSLPTHEYHFHQTSKPHAPSSPS
jgi:hypothetical protein